ncbi:MAG: extracellular solute-binding protein, partial [Clostridiales bacterium]|nr:extracellular solute-binding protein [Clostridiales bacterium]
LALDPLGKYNPMITINAARKSRPNIKFIEGEDYTNNAVNTEYKNQLGINLQYEWIVDESQYEAKVNLMMASGDIPDAFQVTASQEQQLIDAGLILDLTGLFNQYGSPMMKKIVQGNPDLYKTVLVDGKLYDIPMMPSIDFNINVLHVRKDWLDKVGLAAPKTAAELWTVLDAFVNKDPDGNGKKDTIGLPLNKDLTNSVGVGDIGPLFGMYKAYPGAWIKDASGKLTYGSIQPEMKAALQNMQDLYKKGLIDQEFAVKDQGKVAQDIVAEKCGIEFGVFWTPAYPWNDLKKKNTKMEMYNLDIPSVDGSAVNSTVLLTPLVKLVVSKDCKNPEAIIKMVNLAEELWWGSGELAKHWKKVKEDPKYKDIGGVDNNIPLMMMEPPTVNYDLYKEVTDGVNAKDPNVAVTMEGIIEVENSLKYLNDNDLNHWGIWQLRVGTNSSTYISNIRQDNKNYIVSEFYGSPGPVQTEKSSTLQKMEREVITKIIMNAAPVSSFDKFVEQWKTSGGDDLTAEINAWKEKNP